MSCSEALDFVDKMSDEDREKLLVDLASTIRRVSLPSNAALSVIVALLIFGVGWIADFGGQREKVARTADDVRSLSAKLDSYEQANSMTLERLSSDRSKQDIAAAAAQGVTATSLNGLSEAIAQLRQQITDSSAREDRRMDAIQTQMDGLRHTADTPLPTRTVK